MTKEDESTLTITVHPDERSFRVAVAGELDLHTAPRVQHALEQAYDVRPEELILDFQLLYFIDSAGLALLVDVYRRLGRNCVLTLLVSSEGQVRQVLELSRFDRFFHIKYANPDDPT